MTPRAGREGSALTRDIWSVPAVMIGVLLVLVVAQASKVAFYLDVLQASGLLYAVPVAAVLTLAVLISYPRLPLYTLAFLLPFNFVGGFWGDSIFVLIAKMAVTVVAVGTLIPALLAPAGDRAWITQTRLGFAVLLWLAALALGTLIGLVGAPNRAYWLRESSWMALYLCALSFGTLLRGRRDITRLLVCVCGGVAALQAYAFWVLATGQRFARSDAWDAGGSFIRAPYSSQSLFVLYLAAAALLYYSSERRLNGRRFVVLFTAIAFLGGGLLASMGRALWLTGAVGMLVVLWNVEWDRRTIKAVAAVSAGAVLALAVVVVFDRLSPASSGNWTGSAATFLLDLASSESTSRVTRQIEWSNAVDVWLRSPLVGVGFGYPYPPITLGLPPEAEIPEAFFMHNSYLNILAKCGVFGLCALLYLIWVTLGVVRQSLRRQADAYGRILGIALLAALVQVTLLAAMVPVLTASDTAAYAGMLVGIAAAGQRAAKRETVDPPGHAARMAGA